MSKQRIDLLLVERGFFPTRERAKAAVMAGLVYVGEQRVDKPGLKVEPSAAIRVKGELHPYVSRGGLKLEKAIRVFGLDLRDRVVIDVGASTGGFTDCALKHGARKVYAIDVGYGQLAWSLRQDPRVVVMERTNFRHLSPAALCGEKADFAVIDVSFISLALILPNLRGFLLSGAEAVALVKPQFEAGAEQVGKRGIVKEARVHVEVLQKVVRTAADLAFIPRGLIHSPIRGGDGNIEFLLHLQYLPGENAAFPLPFRIAKVVEQAHLELNR